MLIKLIMRPTFLQFRSPKEKTPDPYDSRVTYNGKILDYTRSKSPCFSRGKRFKQYDVEAKKTGYMVGPGSYNNILIAKAKGGYVYKPLYGPKGNVKNCFYVGQILVSNTNDNASRRTDTDWTKSQNSRPSSVRNIFTPSKTSLRAGSPIRKTDSHNNSTPRLNKLELID
jgi:hypothetical protein